MARRPKIVNPHYRIDIHMRPTSAETRRQLKRLEEVYGRELAFAMIGAPFYTGRNWLKRSLSIPPVSRRCIWLVYCITFHPEKLRTLFDWLSWGHFAARRDRGEAGKARVDKAHRPDYEI